MVLIVVRRVLASAVTVLVSTFVVFALVAAGGDPLAELRTDTSPNRAEKIAQRVALLHLDQPLPQRYLGWLAGAGRCAVGHCDLGTTIRGQAVGPLVEQAFGSTVRLVSAAFVLAVLLGTALGMIAALRAGTGLDHAVTALAFGFFSLPVFWVAVLLKQHLAIGVNDWLADPVVGTRTAVAVSLVAGACAAALAGGGHRRRGAAGVGVIAGCLVTLTYVSAVRWFARPALGPVVIGVGGVAAGYAMARLAGPTRSLRRACLATGAVAALAQLAITPWLADHASWGALLALSAGSLLVAALAAVVLGAPDRRRAAGAAAATALAADLLVVADLLLRAVPGYSAAVGGRPVATFGERTPAFAGPFWQEQVDVVSHLALPTLALLLVSLATYSRYARSGLLDVLGADYLRTARAKGLPERRVVLGHALRNAAGPLTMIAAVDLGTLVGGAVVTEYVFGRRGMGALFLDGLREGDPSLVMAFFLVVAVCVAAFNLLADVVHAWLDPRVRFA